MSYKDNCRTCLASGKEMRYIHTTITIGGEDVRMSDILANFYNYKVSTDEEYPENICMNCIYHLTMTYSFKNLIESSAKTLSENSNIVEIDDIDYSYGSEEEGKTYQMRRYERRRHQAIENTESEIKLMFCVECKAEFHSTKELSAHCTNNHPLKSSTGRDCDYCHEKFEDFRSLVLHRKLHLKPYLCENCWEGFYSENELNAHSCQPIGHHKEKNSSDRMLRQCDQCGKSYPPGYIKIHMLTHSNDRPYSCKFCPKKFKVPGGLHSHVLWNHKRTRNHKCEVCNATFISSSSRSSHIRKNHLKEKKYGCESCGKRFFSKSELQRHSLTHTGVKNFHCHLCDKSYQTRYGLNVHLKSHSQMSMNVLNL
ncbi:zinc finger protein 254-like [Cydia amplana]|uniref:zinc finger protein 254-like n=1 Tax=Cydia amplana TaxID=1869771 RepID=UPI002FE594C7